MLALERYNSGKNFHTWNSVQKHLHKFTRMKLPFDQVNEKWMRQFSAYLTSKISNNSANSYFNVLKSSIHQAFREKLIDTDPAFNVKSPRYTNPKREFLTEEEIKKIIPVECKSPILKKAFLFSILTGLRWSDVHNLKWENVLDEEGISYLDYTQRKTGDAERLPINQEARDLIGERQGEFDRVFKGLKYSGHMNDHLKFWMLEAGVKKKISFHCARHTAATLLLNKGVDLYTVCKMLGHKDIKTTQIYAKLVNKSKVEAIQKLPSIFGE